MPYRAHAVITVITALLAITAIIIFMIFVPRHIGLQLEKRRGAAKDVRRWVPLLMRRENPLEQDIEMHGWLLKYPDQAMIRNNRQHLDDWPLLRSEPVVISERRQNQVENMEVGSGSTGGCLEGFPYFVR